MHKAPNDESYESEPYLGPTRFELSLYIDYV